MRRLEITGRQSEPDMFGLMRMLTPHWAAQRGTVHIDRIPIYTVAVRSDRAGFDVEVISGDGRWQIIHGFETMADAHACMAQNKLLVDGVYPGAPSSFRTSWWF